MKDLLEKSEEILKDRHSRLLGSYYFLSSNYRIFNQIDRVATPILNYFLTSTPLDSYHLFFSLYSLYDTLTTKITNELNDLDYHIINVINQQKRCKKRADVDAILNQFIKINGCVDINRDSLVDR